MGIALTAIKDITLMRLMEHATLVMAEQLLLLEMGTFLKDASSMTVKHNNASNVKKGMSSMKMEPVKYHKLEELTPIPTARSGTVLLRNVFNATKAMKSKKMEAANLSRMTLILIVKSGTVVRRSVLSATRVLNSKKTEPALFRLEILTQIVRSGTATKQNASSVTKATSSRRMEHV